MKIRLNKVNVPDRFKPLALLLGLVTVVLMVNWEIIALDLMYPEQPLMYLANQSVKSWSDLINIYLHPAMLNIFLIPFFRPSGHFLLYQLLTPLFGWHDTQALIMVNLVFLALTGLMIIQLYALLFPGWKTGGLIAFAFYLMQPALMLSRLILLHFEFAYIFFMTLALYSFIKFVQHKKRVSLFIAALFLYAIAVTFKEAALLLGPVMALYYLLFSEGPFLPWGWLYRREPRTVVLQLTVTTLILGLYMTMHWPTFSHPLAAAVSWSDKWNAAKEFLSLIFALPHSMFLPEIIYQPNIVWRQVVVPGVVQKTTWLLWTITFISLARLYKHQVKPIKRSCVFLIISAVLFLVLPISWGMAYPWHLSPTLLFVALLIGFSTEFFLSGCIQNKYSVTLISLALVIFLSTATLFVNQANIGKIKKVEGFAFELIHNAYINPPPIQNKLNDESIVVVEDSILHSSYVLGSWSYTFATLKNINFDTIEKLQSSSVIKFQSTYNGTLFRWAYSKPQLKEELYPFSISHMQAVPDSVIYNWLQHANNIYCLGYDEYAKWQNKTLFFKQKLKAERIRRGLQVHQYKPLAGMALKGKTLYAKTLAYPDPQLCQMECDQNAQCRGFTYKYDHHSPHSDIKCQFNEDVAKGPAPFCATCIGFIKEV